MNLVAWIIWAVFALFVILSIVLISGRGSWLIAGYNTASKEEKAKYDEKKLCRINGIGILVIAVLILVIDSLAIIVLSNTICKK